MRGILPKARPASSPYSSFLPTHSFPSNVRYTFLVLNACLLLSGALALGIMAYYLLNPLPRRDVILTPDVVGGALACGAAAVAISLLGFFGGQAPLPRQRALAIYCGLTVLLQVAELVLGAILWFRSLDVPRDYYPLWQSWPQPLRAEFQEYGHCCGFYRPDDFSVPSAGCAALFSPGGATSSINGCSNTLYVYVSAYLERCYSAVFGFIAVAFVAMFSSLVIYLSSRDLQRYITTSEKLLQLRVDP
ncbi:hypothetical protein IWQ60_006230 [Tieghemiomyces parasiticus]|uniref:Tetraspanin n=1 Tax=Tieghemiomyces parasiticus TaxID=78921 RepID=A0A9W8DXT0_9FUNG|nr:hypothetical protein IWQ60_006230 [Tieghemiomyces parasiticus]